MNNKTASNGGPAPEPKYLDSLSGRVLYALELRKMTRMALEEEAKLSRGYVSRVIKGERLKLSPELLRRMSDALQISYEWLATGRGDINDWSPAPASASQPPSQRSQSFALEAAVAYHRNKWSAPAVAAARALSAQPDVAELDPPEWADLLDQIETALGKLRFRRRSV